MQEGTASQRDANLQAALLFRADLYGACRLTCEQLGVAKDLEGATLPDGYQLPGRTVGEVWEGKEPPYWGAAFDAWCQTDEHGFVVPAPLPGDNGGEPDAG